MTGVWLARSAAHQQRQREIFQYLAQRHFIAAHAHGLSGQQVVVGAGAGQRDSWRLPQTSPGPRAFRGSAQRQAGGHRHGHRPLQSIDSGACKGQQVPSSLDGAVGAVPGTGRDAGMSGLQACPGHQRLDAAVVVAVQQFEASRSPSELCRFSMRPSDLPRRA